MFGITQTGMSDRLARRGGLLVALGVSVALHAVVLAFHLSPPGARATASSAFRSTVTLALNRAAPSASQPAIAPPSVSQPAVAPPVPPAERVVSPVDRPPVAQMAAALPATKPHPRRPSQPPVASQTAPESASPAMVARADAAAEPSQPLASRFDPNLLQPESPVAQPDATPSEPGPEAAPSQIAMAPAGPDASAAEPGPLLQAVNHAPEVATADAVPTAPASAEAAAEAEAISESSAIAAVGQMAGLPGVRYYRSSEVDTPAQLLEAAAPDIPDELATPGTVLVRLFISASGHIDGVQIEASDPPGVYDPYVVEAAVQASFLPATKGGVPVAEEMLIESSIAALEQRERHNATNYAAAKASQAGM